MPLVTELEGCFINCYELRYVEANSLKTFQKSFGFEDDDMLFNTKRKTKFKIHSPLLQISDEELLGMNIEKTEAFDFEISKDLLQMELERFPSLSRNLNE